MHYSSGSKCILTVAACLLLASSLAYGVSYSGSLTGSPDNSGGIIASGPWASTQTVLSWVVENETMPGHWRYQYTFTVPSKEISHIMFEVSSGDNPFTKNDVCQTNWKLCEVSVQTFNGQGNSNSNIPEPLYAIKFDEVESLTATIELYTERPPMWGDFYAKDGFYPQGGVWVTAWNAGFTSNDVDPEAAPANGSLNFHLLVPDTGFGPVEPPIPEPLTIVGVLLGAAGVGRYIRKRI